MLGYRKSFQEWLRGLGYNSQINEALYKYLVDEGITPTQLNEMWSQWLTDNNHTGNTLNKKYMSFVNNVLLAPGGGGEPFNPASLFAGSEVGAWYDPSNLSTLFQDSAGTTPVTADGDPVGLMMDLSPNGNHATQSVSASRPVYRTAGGLHWLEFDGVDDRLLIPNETDGAVSSDNTAVFGVQPDDGNTNPYVIGGNIDTGFLMLFNTATEVIRVAVATTAGTLVGNGTTAFTNTSLIYSADWSRSAGRVRGWANQALEVDVTGTPADKTESTTYAIGARGAVSPFLKGRIYGGIIIDRQLSDAERHATEAFMSQKSGVTL